MNIDENLYKEIENEIESTSSPVGIDAKKTHIIIISLLKDLQVRLQKLEEKI